MKRKEIKRQTRRVKGRKRKPGKGMVRKMKKRYEKRKPVLEWRRNRRKEPQKRRRKEE